MDRINNGPINVAVSEGQTLLDALRQRFPDPAQLLLSRSYEPAPSSGFEGGRMLEGIAGELVPGDGEWLKILTANNTLAGFGVEHRIAADEEGSYTFVLEVFDPEYTD